MKLIIKVELEEIKKVNRIIELTDDIMLDDFCEYILTTLNSNIKHPYILKYKNEYYASNDIYEETALVNNIKLSDLKLKQNSKLTLRLNNHIDYIIEVLEIEKTNIDNYFKVINGKYLKIPEKMELFEYTMLLEPIKTKRDVERQNYYIKKYKLDNIELIDIDKLNEDIKIYIERKKDILKPKIYEVEAKLVGFEKEIKRKIILNGNIDLDSFCICTVLAFKGDLSHLYTIKMGKDWLEDHELINTFSYLELKEKQKIKVLYDFGDSWEFQIQIKKIKYEKNDEISFKVIDGKGYGIIDDCGGIWGLENIFSGQDEEWGDYDINEFSLEETNEYINKHIQINNL